MTFMTMIDLEEGDEITIDYNGDSAPLNRSDRLNHIFGFRCACPMCLEEKDDTHFAERADILRKFKDDEDSLGTMQPNAAIQIVQGVIQQVERTYTQGLKYRRLLRGPRQRLSALYCNAAKMDQSIAAMEKVLQWDSPWPESCLLDELILAELCFAGNKKDQATQHLKQVLKWVEIVSAIKPRTFLALQTEYLKTRRFGPFVMETINRLYPAK
jgi:hypothetical protein